MKWSRLILSLGLAGGLAAGCASTDPEKFEQEVHHWVPLGTSVKEAQKIMKHHGFECTLVSADNRFNRRGVTYLECERPNTMLKHWNTIFLINDGKVSSYGESLIE